MPYTANKKIGGLDQVTTPLGDNDNFVVEQSGTAKRGTLAQLIAKIFTITNNISPTVNDAAVVIQSNGNVGKAALTSLIPAGSVTNDSVSATAGILDTKLAAISTTGKVLNSATTATNTNTTGAIVSRDGSGNFAAGTITATLSGNASTATNLAGGTANSVPYQSAAGSTQFLAAGSANTFLRSNGVGAPPSWESFSATTTNATHLTGGTAGSVPYQASPGNTVFLEPGPAGSVLTSSGVGQLPTYTAVADTTATANTIVKRNNSGNFTGTTITATTGFSGGSFSGTTGTFSGAVSAGAVSGTTGTFSGTVTAPTFSGAVSGTTGTFSGAVSGTTGTFSGAVSGTTGTFSSHVTGVDGKFSGNVGVGTTTPSQKLDVNGNINASGYRVGGTPRMMASAVITFNNSGITNSFVSSGSITFARNSTGAYTLTWTNQPAGILGWATATPVPMCRVASSLAGTTGTYAFNFRNSAAALNDIQAGETATIIFF